MHLIILKSFSASTQRLYTTLLHHHTDLFVILRCDLLCQHRSFVRQQRRFEFWCDSLYQQSGFGNVVTICYTHKTVLVILMRLVGLSQRFLWFCKDFVVLEARLFWLMSTRVAAPTQPCRGHSNAVTCEKSAQFRWVSQRSWQFWDAWCINSDFERAAAA